jgi:hypothetical protein
MHRLLLAGFCVGGLVAAETRFGAELRKEREALGGCTEIKKLLGCGETLFTGKPFHIAVGSLAPGNGFGSGLAVVGHWTTDNWRNSWNADAVATPNGSWRAGAYLKLVWSKQPGISVDNTGAANATGAATASLQERPVLHFYSEATSLNRVAYFGLGPATRDTARSFFGLREIVTGGSAVFPLKFTRRLNAALLGEANSRAVEIRASTGQPSPSIERLYTPATAPGLAQQPAFAQFGEGVRIRPSAGNLRFNYLVNSQQYVAPGNSVYSFQRFTVDLGNQFALYKTTRTLQALAHNGPDDCTADPADTDHKCPEVKFPRAGSRNLEGSIGVRLLIEESIVPGGHVVPFYFQPTLGGSDIGGNHMLGSYQDYRFRAPNLLLFRANFEHSVWGPFGAMFVVDEGKVALRRGDIDFSHLVHSYSAGLTLRAGGFPMVQLLFSWGGHEGMHTTGALNTSLLGGAARPAL